MRKLTTLTAAMLNSTLALAQVTDAAVLATYNLAGAPGDQATSPATPVMPTVTATDLTRGPGILANAGGGAFTSRGFGTQTTIDLADYVQVGIAPVLGNTLSIDTLFFGTRRSSQGPQTIEVRSSLDNYAASLSTIILVNADSNILRTVSLPTAFDNLLTGVNFRIYGYAGVGASAATATFRLTQTTSDPTNPNAFTFDGSTAALLPVNVSPVVTILPSSVTVDVEPEGLEGFTGVIAAAVDVGDVITSFANGFIPAQIVDNLTITGGENGTPISISGSGFTFADVGTYQITFTATDDESATGSAVFTINIVPEPTTLAALAGLGVVAGRRRRSA